MIYDLPEKLLRDVRVFLEAADDLDLVDDTTAGHEPEDPDELEAVGGDDKLPSPEPADDPDRPDKGDGEDGDTPGDGEQVRQPSGREEIILDPPMDMPYR